MYVANRVGLSSLTQMNFQAIAQGSQRVDDVPTVQTKAKMVQSRGSASDFGMESMFQKSRSVLIYDRALLGAETSTDNDKLWQMRTLHQ